MIRKEESLDYHAGERAGKIEVRPVKPCLTAREMRMAYLPGAAFACEEIAADPAAAFRYTSRGNVVPLAAKPMQEGLAILFKRLADIDVFDLEIDAEDPDAFIETVRRLEPGFGGIVLKDIRAPEGLRIYDELREALNIPVFHENLQSSAVVAVAALSNALDLVDKKVPDVRTVVCGAGSVGIGCCRLLLHLGVRPENLIVYDSRGILDDSREDLTPDQRAFARNGAPATLAEG